MATVNVVINDKTYGIGCADGQEDRVAQLAKQFDEHVRQVATDVGQVGEIRLFLMAALLVSDELSDMRGQLARLRLDYERGTPGGGGSPLVAQALTAAAERVERLLLETA